MSAVMLDVLFLIAGGLILFLCIKSGFFKTLMHFCRFLLAFLAAYFLGSKVAAWLSEQFFFKPIYNSVYQKIEGLYRNATEEFDSEKIISAFPKFLMSDAMKNEINGMDEAGEALVERASHSVASALSGIVSAIVGYILVFVIALLLSFLISIFLGKLIHSLPLLNTVDRILGGLLGFLIAFSLLYLIGTMIRFFWGETDFYARSSIIRFFGNLKLPKILSFLNFRAFISRAFNSIKMLTNFE